MLGQLLFSHLVARSVLVTGSPCSLQGLCVAQRHRLGDLLAVRFDDALLACGRLRSLGETLRDPVEACGLSVSGADRRGPIQAAGTSLSCSQPAASQVGAFSSVASFHAAAV